MTKRNEKKYSDLRKYSVARNFSFDCFKLNAYNTRNKQLSNF